MGGTSFVTINPGRTAMAFYNQHGSARAARRQQSCRLVKRVSLLNAGFIALLPVFSRVLQRLLQAMHQYLCIVSFKESIYEGIDAKRSDFSDSRC
jgi:hypothetical protein